MKRSICLMLTLVLVAIAVIFGAPSRSSAAAGPQFSADYIVTSGKTVSTGRIFFKFDRIRQEFEGSVTIVRLDKMVAWVFMPGNLYIEKKLTFDPNQTAPTGGEYTRNVLGSETVNGYDCEVVELVFKDTKLGVTKQWIYKKLGVAVKTESRNAKGRVESITEIKNIKEEPLEDGLFEIPAGYKKLF